MKISVSSWSFAECTAVQGRLLFSMGWSPGVWCLETWSYQLVSRQILGWRQGAYALGKALSPYFQDIQWKWEHLQTVAPREELWLCRGHGWPALVLAGMDVDPTPTSSGLAVVTAHPRSPSKACVPYLSSSWGLCWYVNPVLLLHEKTLCDPRSPSMERGHL